MVPVEFAYQTGGAQLAVSVFADRARVRDEIFEDAIAAGLAVRASGPLAALLEDDVRALGDIVLIDCPQVSGAELAALSRLDLRAARSGAHFIVATSVASLDDVFACCDQSAPQILVDPSRAELAIALGRAQAQATGLRLRELSDGERLMLLQLSEQVSQIADRLGRNEPGLANGGSFTFENLTPPSSPAAEEGQRGRSARPSLPDPALLRKIIRLRQLRARFFDGELFSDPAWDILLDLAAARAEHKRVSVTSLCIASGVPPTTALRWIGHMTEAGLLVRLRDDSDRRRVFIALSDSAAGAMAGYFAELDCRVPQPV